MGEFFKFINWSIALCANTTFTEQNYICTQCDWSIDKLKKLALFLKLFVNNFLTNDEQQLKPLEGYSGCDLDNTRSLKRSSLIGILAI